MNNKDNLKNRLQRYTSVSTSLASSALLLFKDQVTKNSNNHQKRAKILREALGNLKGPIMKIAQILSTIPDSLPQEYLLEFQSLQAEAPAMGWSFVKRRMKNELGENWQNLFIDFEKQATFAASLGQVHKAISLDNQQLACKLQYPNMISTVNADLQQFKLLLKIYEKYIGGLITEEIFIEISQRLKEEIDYGKEVQNIKLYQQIFANRDDINIPQVITKLSTSQLITMSWLNGLKTQDILEESQEYRNKVAKKIFYAWYYPLYRHQVIHGDPHLGNYTFTKDGNINILDFGCIRHFSKQFIQGVITLHSALINNDIDTMADIYKTWGFTNLTKEVLEILNIWAKLLYEPILDDKIRYIQKNNSGIYGRQIADKVHKKLQKVGGIKIPKEFVFMDRATVGIGSLCMHLRAKLNWQQLYYEIIN